MPDWRNYWTRLMLSSKIYTFDTLLFSRISNMLWCLFTTYIFRELLSIQCSVYLAHLFLPDYDKTKELGLSHFFGLMITTKKWLSLLWPKVLCHGTLVYDNHIMNKFLGSAAIRESNNQHLLKPSKYFFVLKGPLKVPYQYLIKNLNIRHYSIKV